MKPETDAMFATTNPAAARVGSLGLRLCELGLEGRFGKLGQRRRQRSERRGAWLFFALRQRLRERSVRRERRSQTVVSRLCAHREAAL